jgi:hypothetical protein
MRSRALSTMYGSVVLRVVRTVMLPSTRLSSQAILCASSALVTMGQTSRRYFSRYLGKSVAKELSSSRLGMPRFLPGVLSSSTSSCHGSTFQWSMSSESHGLSLRWLFFCASASTWLRGASPSNCSIAAACSAQSSPWAVVPFDQPNRRFQRFWRRANRYRSIPVVQTSIRYK